MIGDHCRLLFVGINPGLQTAMTGIHFAHPSNRFWPALRKAGLIDWAPNVSPATPSVRIEAENQARTGPRHSRLPNPTNRLYAAACALELIDVSVDASIGMTEAQRDDFLSKSMGITNLVNRATVRASELGKQELRTGSRRLRELVSRLSPAIVAIAGITAYRDAFDERKARPGPQQTAIAGCEVWVVPNPSGLNAHETVDSLAASYRDVAEAAGVI